MSSKLANDVGQPLLAAESGPSGDVLLNQTHAPDDLPPPFEDAIATGPGAAPTELPPNYYAVSVTPNVPWMLPHEWRPNGRSNVEIERNSDLNVISYAKELESNPDEIWKYFLTYSDAPRMEIQIEGYRYEDRWHTEFYTENGHQRSRQVHRRERVTDFLTRIDASNYVNPQWQRVVSIGKNGQARSIRDVLEEFTRSRDRLKEIGMTKQVAWDFAQLTPALTSIARSIYPHYIQISYVPTNSHVTACASNQTARLARNNWIRCLLVITCLWICALPVWLYRRNVQALVMEFVPVAPVNVFYQRNYYNIRNAIASRTSSILMAV